MRFAFWVPLGTLGVCLSLTGCSFSGGEPKSLTHASRSALAECSGIDLSSPQLSSKTLLNLLRCLNATGETPGPIESWVRFAEGLPASDLDYWTDFLNRFLIQKPRRIYELYATVQMLDNAGELQPLLQNSVPFLENPDAVLAWVEWAVHAPELVQALSRLSRQFDAQAISETIDIALTVTGSKAFYSLQKHLRDHRPQGRSAEQIATDLLNYFEATRESRTWDLGYEFFWHLYTGELFESADLVLGKTESDLRQNTSNVTQFFKGAFADNGKIFEGLCALVNDLHGPISCLNEEYRIESGAMRVAAELAQSKSLRQSALFYQRDYLLTFIVTNSFCQNPPAVSTHYEALFDFSQSLALGPAISILKSFQKVGETQSGVWNRPLTYALMNVMSVPSVKNLIPAMVELTERNVWDDLFLLSNLLSLEDRPAFMKSLRHLVDPREGVNGKSIYKTVTENLPYVPVSAIMPWLQALEKWVTSEPPVLAPFLRSARSAFYVNSSHPVAEVLLEVFQSETELKRFLSFLSSVRISRGFKEALGHTAEMNRDGRTARILKSFLDLFENSNARYPLAKIDEPRFKPKSRHNLDESDLDGSDLVKVNWLASSECRALSASFRLDSIEKSTFESDLHAYLSCLEGSASAGVVSSHRSYLKKQPILKTSPYRLLVDWVSDLSRSLGQAELMRLTSGWAEWVDDGRFFRTFSIVAWWVKESEIARTTLNAIGRLEPWVEPVQRIEVFFKRFWSAGENSEESLKVFNRVWNEWKKIPDPKIEIATIHTPASYLRDFAKKIECKSSEMLERRTKQIQDDYRFAITSHEWVAGQAPNTWTFSPLYDRARLVVDRLTSTSSSGKTIFSAFPSWVRRFRDGKSLASWTHQWANQEYLVPYFYPGEKNPRARLINAFDALELFWVNSDVSLRNLPVVSHFPFLPDDHVGLLFLGKLAEAWGDEPRSEWPEEIQRRYAGNQRPPRLKEVVAEIEQVHALMKRFVGYPELPDCVDLPSDDTWLGNLIPTEYKIKGFNLGYLLPILRDSLPDSTSSLKGGLRPVRNLLWEIHSTTPIENRNASAGDKNHLSVFRNLVQVGFLRGISRQLMGHEGWMKGELESFSALYQMAQRDLAADLSAYLRKIYLSGTLKKGFEDWFRLDATGRLRAKASAHYALASFNRLTQVHPNLSTNVTARLREVLRVNPDAVSVLASYWLQSAVTRSVLFSQVIFEKLTVAETQTVAEWMNQMMTDVNLIPDLLTVFSGLRSDPVFMNYLEKLRAESRRLESYAGYQAAQGEVGSALDFLVDFFSETEEYSTQHLSGTIRESILWRFDSRTLIHWAAHDSEEIYRLLDSFSGSVDEGGFQRFMQLIRRSLVAPRT